MEGQWAAVAMLVGLPVVVALAWWYTPKQRALRLLRAHVVTPIAKLRPGERARIAGRVRCEEPLTSPLLERDVAAFQLQILEKVGKSWSTRVDDKQARAFWIEDDSGQCLVRATPERLFLKLERREGFHLFDPPKDHEEAVCRRYGFEAYGTLNLTKSVKLEESILEPGEVAEVLGVVAIEERDGEVILTLQPDPVEGLVVTDHPV